MQPRFSRSPDARLHPAGKARILIADDDPVTRELLAGLIEGLGQEPVAVPDGAAALETVEMEVQRGRWDPKIVRAFRQMLDGSRMT